MKCRLASRKIISSFLYFYLFIGTAGFAQEKKLPYGLQIFKNIEQIEYCVALPLQEYYEKYDVERAHHSFVYKKNKKLRINIRGYYCDDKNTTLEKLCNSRYTSEEEAAGKIITKKIISKADHCFYAIGYYNNFIYKYEFLEIIWLRNDEVTILEIEYDLKDKALWQKRLNVILKNADCK
jgi:hypothetical protein